MQSQALTTVGTLISLFTPTQDLVFAHRDPRSTIGEVQGVWLGATRALTVRFSQQPVTVQTYLRSVTQAYNIRSATDS
jgi:hypothetical protein